MTSEKENRPPRPITSYKPVLMPSRSLTLHMRCPTGDEQFLSGIQQPYYYILAAHTSRSSGDIHNFAEFIYVPHSNGGYELRPHVPKLEKDVNTEDLDIEPSQVPLQRTDPIRREDGKKIRPQRRLNETATQKETMAIEQHIHTLLIAGYTLEAGEIPDFHPYERNKFGGRDRPPSHFPNEHNDPLMQLEGASATSIIEQAQAEDDIDGTQHPQPAPDTSDDPSSPHSAAAESPAVATYPANKQRSFGATPMRENLERYLEKNKTPTKRTPTKPKFEPPSIDPREPQQPLSDFIHMRSASNVIREIEGEEPPPQPFDPLGHRMKWANKTNGSDTPGKLAELLSPLREAPPADKKGR